jgi:hypothetical protein
VNPPSPAGGLDITERLGTVQTHVSNLLTKLDARPRVHLVVAAHEAHLVRGRPPYAPAAPGVGQAMTKGYFLVTLSTNTCRE